MCGRPQLAAADRGRDRRPVSVVVDQAVSLLLPGYGDLRRVRIAATDHAELVRLSSELRAEAKHWRRRARRYASASSGRRDSGGGEGQDDEGRAATAAQHRVAPRATASDRGRSEVRSDQHHDLVARGVGDQDASRLCLKTLVAAVLLTIDRIST